MKQALFATILLLGLGCTSETDSTPGPEVGSSILDIAEADGRFDTLTAAVERAGLTEALSGEGPFTVFAPTDEAFSRLPEGLLDSLSAEQLASILTYHVVGDRVDARTASGLDSAPTLEGSAIDISLEGPALYLNGLTLVVSADIAADNGIIHVVDSVLVPGEFPGSIVDAVVAYPRLSLLANAVTPGVVEALSADGRTLFAPVNSAFEGVTLPSDIEPVLFYHAIAADVPASEVVSLRTAQTASGAYVAVRADSSGVALDDSYGETRVIYTDIETSNGVIHLIDGVLTPPGNIAEVADRAGFSTLTSLLGSAGLASTIAEEGPFTVFAPTNEAFGLLPEDADLTAVLADVLLHHTMSGAIDSRAVGEVIAAGGMAGTLTGAEDNLVQVAAQGSNVVINGLVTVTATDIPASNGIIHVIDSVIIPSDITFPGTIVDAVAAYPNLSSLLDAVGSADASVAATLDGAGDFTLFAPYNDAFDGVDTSADLTPILLYHALGAAADSTAVVSYIGSSVTTLGGGDVFVADGPSLTDAAGNSRNIVRVDLRASNGVIHVIDGILLPE